MITVSIHAVRMALRGLRLLQPRKNQDAALRCIRILGVEELVTFAAATPREHLRYEALGVSDIPGDLLVPFDQLAHAIRTADAGSSISLTPGPGPSLTTVVAATPVTTAIDPVDAGTFPVPPTGDGASIELAPRAIRGLREALEVTSHDPTREVLHGVHLEPEAIVATDGRQLHAQRGLRLAVPASGLLIPQSPVIGLLDEQKPADLFVCRDASGAITHVKVFQAPWTWTVQLGDLQFPNWRQVVPKPESLPTKLEFSEADVVRLLATLPRLPGADLDNAPVWMLAGESGVTLQSPPSTAKVALPLSTSRVTGPAAQVAFNRTFLLRALATGLRKLHLRDAVTPVCMRDDNRLHLWMPVRLADPEPVAAIEPVREFSTAAC